MEIFFGNSTAMKNVGPIRFPMYFISDFPSPYTGPLTILTSLVQLVSMLVILEKNMVKGQYVKRKPKA